MSTWAILCPSDTPWGEYWLPRTAAPAQPVEAVRLFTENRRPALDSHRGGQRNRSCWLQGYPVDGAEAIARGTEPSVHSHTSVPSDPPGFAGPRGRTGESIPHTVSSFRACRDCQVRAWRIPRPRLSTRLSDKEPIMATALLAFTYHEFDTIRTLTSGG